MDNDRDEKKKQNNCQDECCQYEDCEVLDNESVCFSPCRYSNAAPRQDNVMYKKYIIECPVDIKRVKLVTEDGSDLFLEEGRIRFQQCDENQCDYQYTDWVTLQGTSTKASNNKRPNAPVENVPETKNDCCYNCPYHNQGPCCINQREKSLPPYGRDPCCNEPPGVKSPITYKTRASYNPKWSAKSSFDSKIASPIRSKSSKYGMPENVSQCSKMTKASRPIIDYSCAKIDAGNEAPACTEDVNVCVKSKTECQDICPVLLNSPLSCSSNFMTPKECSAQINSPPPPYSSEDKGIMPKQNTEQPPQISISPVAVLSSPNVSFADQSATIQKINLECIKESRSLICVVEQPLSNEISMPSENIRSIITSELCSEPAAINPIPINECVSNSYASSRKSTSAAKPFKPVTKIPKSRVEPLKTGKPPPAKPQSIPGVPKKPIQKFKAVKPTTTPRTSPMANQPQVNKPYLESVVIIGYIGPDEELSTNEDMSAKSTSIKFCETTPPPQQEECSSFCPPTGNVSRPASARKCECGSVTISRTNLGATEKDESLLKFIEESYRVTEKNIEVNRPLESVQRNDEIDISLKNPDKSQVFSEQTLAKISANSRIISTDSKDINQNGSNKIVEDYKELERIVENVDAISETSGVEVKSAASQKTVEELKITERSIEISEAPKKSQISDKTDGSQKTIEHLKENEVSVEISAPVNEIPKEKAVDVETPKIDSSKMDDPAENESPKTDANKSKSSSCCCKGKQSSSDTYTPKEASKAEDTFKPIHEEEEELQKDTPPVEVKTVIADPPKEIEPNFDSTAEGNEIPVDQNKNDQFVCGGNCQCQNIEDVLKRYFEKKRVILEYPIDNEDFNLKPGYRCISSQTPQSWIGPPKSNGSSSKTSKQSVASKASTSTKKGPPGK